MDPQQPLEPITSPSVKGKEKDKSRVSTTASKRKKILATMVPLALEEVSVSALLQNLFQRLPYTPVDMPANPPLPVTLYTTDVGRTKIEHVAVDRLIEIAGAVPEERLSFIWADVIVEDIAALQLLAEAFAAPDMAIPFADRAVERLESYPDHFLITLREESTMYGKSAHELKVFVIRQHWIVTLHAEPLVLVGAAARDVAELSHAVTSPSVVLFALLLEACTSTEPYIDRIYAELQALEQLVLIFSGGEESDLLLRIANARTRIADTNMAALSKTTVLKELHALKGVLPLEVRYMIDELATVQQQLVGRLQLASSVLSNQTSTYLSRVSLHVAVNTEKVNVVMKRLNAISTIMLPLLAIQGIFSMNVKVPGRDVPNLNWFWSLCGIFVLSTIILFFGLKRLGWW